MCGRYRLYCLGEQRLWTHAESLSLPEHGPASTLRSGSKALAVTCGHAPREFSEMRSISVRDCQLESI